MDKQGSSSSSLSRHDFIVVRSKDIRDATVRLQSEPLLQGLTSLGCSARCFNPLSDAAPVLEPRHRSILIFHYNDVAAVDAVRSIRGPRGDIVGVCLCSDIYSFDRYINVDDITDFYVVPTSAHRSTLAYQLYKPVHVVPEAIDPFSRPSRPRARPRGRRVLWFGYAESFAKSMISLLPVIDVARQKGWIDDFVLMVDKGRFPNRSNLETIEYDHEKFADYSSEFDYCLLSHFSLDLAVNSVIKSPNKAISSIMAGLVPIVSATPSYAALFESLGLDRFMYSSADELCEILSRLEPDGDHRVFRDLNVAARLESELAPPRIAQKFLDALQSFQTPSQHAFLRTCSPISLDKAAPSVGFKTHITDLVPSAMRAVKLRLNARQR